MLPTYSRLTESPVPRVDGIPWWTWWAEILDDGKYGSVDREIRETVLACLSTTIFEPLYLSPSHPRPSPLPGPSLLTNVMSCSRRAAAPHRQCRSPLVVQHQDRADAHSAGLVGHGSVQLGHGEHGEAAGAAGWDANAEL